jgi:streptogrisin C
MSSRFARSLAALAAAVTAALAASGTAAAAPAPAVGAPSTSPLVAALQRDLRLGPVQATERLAREANARSTESRLRTSLGSRFGGAWLSGDAGRLVVAITDPHLTGAVRAAGAEPRLVQRSERQLDAVKERLDRAPRPAPEAVSGWYVDVVTNTVVVRAAPDSSLAAADLVRAGGVDPAAVRVVTATETPRPLEIVPNAIYGGSQLTVPLGRCSIGFAIGNFVEHVHGYVTAGHCGVAGDRATLPYQARATFRASVFPGNDQAWVRQDDFDFDTSPFPIQRVLDYQGGSVAVEGLQEAPVGSSVCRSGSTTGFRCGTIVARNETVNYVEGAVVGLTRTTACAEPGDSGGPFLAGGQAQGTLSGGLGSCAIGGVTFFQPLNPVLRAYQLRLATINGYVDPPAA